MSWEMVFSHLQEAASSVVPAEEARNRMPNTKGLSRIFECSEDNCQPEGNARLIGTARELP